MTHHDKARELVERVAAAWASIDGKLQAFNDDNGKDPMLGYRDGYLHEAQELLERSGLQDLITAQAEENRRLREALRGMVGLYDSDEGTRNLPEVVAARAALSSTGEKG